MVFMMSLDVGQEVDLVDKDGVPRIYYTAGNNNRFPNQAVALAQPEDTEEDPFLKKWKNILH